MYVLLAIAIGAIAGMLVGGLVESLNHNAHLAGTTLRNGGVPSGANGTDVMADIIGAGFPDHFITGAVGGFFGFAVSGVRGAYRAALDAAKDNCGPVIAGGIVLAVVVCTGIVPVDGVGLLTAISGFAAGSSVGAIVADA